MNKAIMFCAYAVAASALVEAVARAILAAMDYRVKKKYAELVDARVRQLKAAEAVQDKLRQMAEMDDAWEPCEDEEGEDG